MSEAGNGALHIVQCSHEDSTCLGCASCELLCGMRFDGKSGLGRAGIHLERADLLSLFHTVYTCQQCPDHPCYEACPQQDEAMCVDEKGIVYINEENCVGCGQCAQACKFTPSRIVMVDDKARKCDLCRGRAEGPLCIEQCPACCLELAGETK